MSRYFPPFLIKSYLPIQIKSVINWTGHNVYNKQMIVTDNKIESAQETSVRCKAWLMRCESLWLERDAGKYPLSVLVKTYELFVGTNETVLYMWVSVERDSNVRSSPSIRYHHHHYHHDQHRRHCGPCRCRNHHHHHYFYHCWRYWMLPITTTVVLFFF